MQTPSAVSPKRLLDAMQVGAQASFEQRGFSCILDALIYSDGLQMQLRAKHALYTQIERTQKLDLTATYWQTSGESTEWQPKP